MTAILPADRLEAAMTVIATWRASPEPPHPCPVCGAMGLAISDHSARPYAEWYRLACRNCGLDHMLQIPLGPPVAGGGE